MCVCVCVCVCTLIHVYLSVNRSEDPNPPAHQTSHNLAFCVVISLTCQRLLNTGEIQVGSSAVKCCHFLTVYHCGTKAESNMERLYLCCEEFFLCGAKLAKCL